MSDIQHKIIIHQLRKYHQSGGANDVVFKVEYACNGSTLDDSGQPINYSTPGSIDVHTHGDPVDANNFTSFVDLSEEQVVGWVESSLGAQKLAEIWNNIDGILNASKAISPTTILPWNNISAFGTPIVVTLPDDNTATPK